MAIFTRFGTRVEFVSAEAVPVLIEQTRDGERRWRATSEYEEVDVWHARAKDAETERPIAGGGQIPSHEFVADDGFREIMIAMRAAAEREG